MGKGKRANKRDLTLTKGANKADSKVVNRILDFAGGKKGKVEIVTRGGGTA